MENLSQIEIFQQNADNDDLFALAEKNLGLLGPMHEAVKQVGGNYKKHLKNYKIRGIFHQNSWKFLIFWLETLKFSNFPVFSSKNNAFQIGKRQVGEREFREPRHIELPPIEGPKTRGASKRRNVETSAPGKKQKL